MSAHKPAMRPIWLVRCVQLREDDKLGWDKIAETMKNEGYRDGDDKPRKADNLRSSYKRNKKAAEKAKAAGKDMELSETSEPSEVIKEIRSEASEISDATDISEPSDATVIVLPDQSADEPLPDTWKAEIINLIRGELTKMQTSQTFQKTASIELAPVPITKVDGLKHRKVNPWERVKVGVTLDKALSDLLEAKRKELGDVSLSRALDTVLWQYFGKPPLSFEQVQPDVAVEPPDPDPSTDGAD